MAVFLPLMALLLPAAPFAEPRWADMHPALRPSRADLERLWTRAMRDAASGKDYRRFQDLARRSLGSSGFTLLINPEFVIYMDAYNLEKNGMPKPAAKNAMRESVGMFLTQKSLRFHIDLTEKRKAAPGITLRVGKKAYPLRRVTFSEDHGPKGNQWVGEAMFELFGGDGSARVGKAEQAFTLEIESLGGVKKATYRLADLARMRR